MRNRLGERLLAIELRLLLSSRLLFRVQKGRLIVVCDTLEIEKHARSK